MAAATWPTQLQQNVNQGGFQKQYGETVIRSNNDVGPQKVRRRSTRPRDLYTVSILVSGAEESVLSTFFNTTVNGGAGTFIFNDPINGNSYEWRFTGPPVVSSVGFDTFNVSMAWERLNDA